MEGWLLRENCPVKQVVIENPVIDGRRSSSYFVPIARPRRKGQKQSGFDTEWTQDRIEEVPVGYRTAVVMRFDPNGCECLPDDPRNCYWLYIVTNCGSNPILQQRVQDPVRFEWHEVSKVAHYCLSLDTLKGG
jgi:hypothetical protein